MAKHKFRIFPLGGLGEIGKNMTLFEYGHDAFIIDSGIMFPNADMHGIDYIIPDFSYLKTRTDLKIHGFVYTHGHEDHIGAVPHIAETFPGITMYGTRLTTELLKVKLKNGRRNMDNYDSKLLETTPVEVIEPGVTFNVGPFKIEPFRVTHSIPDCVGFAIHTPFGLVLHTGDYKFDNNPVDGKRSDYGALARFGNEGVKLLLGDSTNADKSGWDTVRVDHRTGVRPWSFPRRRAASWWRRSPRCSLVCSRWPTWRASTAVCWPSPATPCANTSR